MLINEFIQQLQTCVTSSHKSGNAVVRVEDDLEITGVTVLDNGNVAIHCDGYFDEEDDNPGDPEEATGFLDDPEDLELSNA